MCHMRRRIHVPLAMTETPNTHKKIKISQSLSRDPAICHIHTCHTCTHVSVSVWKEPLRNTTHTYTHVTHAHMSEYARQKNPYTSYTHRHTLAHNLSISLSLISLSRALSLSYQGQEAEEPIPILHTQTPTHAQSLSLSLSLSSLSLSLLSLSLTKG